MTKDRSHMTIRVVRQQSRDAHDARTGGTVAERVELVAEMAEFGWALAKKKMPVYTRATMPVYVARPEPSAPDHAA